MKLLISILVFVFLQGTSSELSTLRTLYNEAKASEAANNKLLALSSKNTSNATYKGYYAAGLMFKANHVLNPMSKLSYFNKGKLFLEEALKESKYNVELHFIRYTIQDNAPPFLGYNDQLITDRAILKSAINWHKDKELVNIINNYIQLENEHASNN